MKSDLVLRLPIDTLKRIIEQRQAWFEVPTDASNRPALDSVPGLAGMVVSLQNGDPPPAFEAVVTDEDDIYLSAQVRVLHVGPTSLCDGFGVPLQLASIRLLGVKLFEDGRSVKLTPRLAQKHFMEVMA